MAKKKGQTKGIFCLEEPAWWGGIKNRTTVEPVLRLLEKLKGLEVPYLHHDCATREEFEFFLRKWVGGSFGKYPILYLGFHGGPGEITVEGESVTLKDLEDLLGDGTCAGRLIHFGACNTLAARERNDQKLDRFLEHTGALAVCGYRRSVDFLESCAFEVLLLGRLQSMSFRRSDSVRKFDDELQELAPGLYEKLGFRMQWRD